jgi:signal transduction histidine kinase
MLVALGLAFGLIWLNSDPQAKDIRLLAGFMLGTGLFTILGTHALYRYGFLNWFNSLRWTLLATIILTVLLLYVNVWLTAQLMFISNHDLILTTSLLIFAGVVAVMMVFFFSGVLIDRIHDLGQTAKQLANGDLTARLHLEGNDELTELARTFNRMADALQTVDEQKQALEKTRRDLIAWISHDLRTPLTALRAMNEAILDGVVSDPTTIDRYMRNSQKEIAHLNYLIADLFELAQLDAARLTIQPQPINLSQFIADSIEGLQARLQQQQITWQLMLGPEVLMVQVDPYKMQRVLDNLLENAIQHTPPQGCISLSVQPTPQQVVISLHNTGSYISPEHLPHIFSTFYRGESARAQSAEGQRGVGLGLAIARGFVEAQGGSISANSHPQTGTTFTVQLPKL